MRDRERARGRDGGIGCPSVRGVAFGRRRDLVHRRAEAAREPAATGPALLRSRHPALGRLALSAIGGLVALFLALGAGKAHAQSDGLALSFDPGIDDAPLFDRAPHHTDGRYVVIRLAENRLYVFEGERVLWSAPVGTGTGFRLEGRGRTYKFATPRGVFRVQAKEKDPVWIRPDWDFIENHQPIPPLNSPLRREPGTLGATAMYIGYELAMHGTDKPDLVLRPDPDARRISHGCIRLTDEDARKLFYLVDIGTPVLIF